jgi:hypothetical protein
LASLRRRLGRCAPAVGHQGSRALFTESRAGSILGAASWALDPEDCAAGPACICARRVFGGARRTAHPNHARLASIYVPTPIMLLGETSILTNRARYLGIVGVHGAHGGLSTANAMSGRRWGARVVRSTVEVSDGAASSLAAGGREPGPLQSG